MKRLENKVAVIIGGNSGIGLASAHEFATEGAKVVITGRNADTLKTAAHQLGGDVLTVQADISKLGDIEPIYTQTKARFGLIDVLFVNAGIFKGLPLDQMTEELYDEVMDINVKGVFFSVQKALPYLKDGASIILTSSTVNELGLPGASAYSASKAAVRSLARTFSADLLPRGIRVNVISPGPISTPIFGRLGLPKEVLDTVLQGFENQVPIHRMGSVEEIAKAVVFLASKDSSYMLGAEVVLDGGLGQL